MRTCESANRQPVNRPASRLLGTLGPTDSLLRSRALPRIQKQSSPSSSSNEWNGRFLRLSHCLWDHTYHIPPGHQHGPREAGPQRPLQGRRPSYLTSDRPLPSLHIRTANTSTITYWTSNVPSAGADQVFLLHAQGPVCVAAARSLNEIPHTSTQTWNYRTVQ
jgi:hypothetical protein